MFCSDQSGPGIRAMSGPDVFPLAGAQPNGRVARLIGVTAHLASSTTRRLAVDLLLRLAAIVLAGYLILGLLPTIAEAVA
jgi:hypothetical protein